MLRFLILVFCVPFILSLLFYFKLKKYLWLTPVITLVLALFLLFLDILTYMPREGFKEQFRLFFHNDTAMVLWVLYFPMIIASIFFTIVFISINKSKR
jgi:hypothetical protein